MVSLVRLGSLRPRAKPVTNFGQLKKYFREGACTGLGRKLEKLFVPDYSSQARDTRISYPIVSDQRYCGILVASGTSM